MSAPSERRPALPQGLRRALPFPNPGMAPEPRTAASPRSQGARGIERSTDLETLPRYPQVCVLPRRRDYWPLLDGAARCRREQPPSRSASRTRQARRRRKTDSRCRGLQSVSNPGLLQHAISTTSPQNRYRGGRPVLRRAKPLHADHRDQAVGMHAPNAYRPSPGPKRSLRRTPSRDNRRLHGRSTASWAARSMKAPPGWSMTISGRLASSSKYNCGSGIWRRWTTGRLPFPRECRRSPAGSPRRVWAPRSPRRQFYLWAALRPETA